MAWRWVLLVAATAAVASGDEPQSSTLRQDLSALRYVMAADSMGGALEDLFEKELSLGRLEPALASLAAGARPLSPDAVLAAVARNMSALWTGLRGATEALRTKMLQLHLSRPMGPTRRHFQRCCELPDAALSADPLWGAAVNGSLACDVLPPSTAAFSFRSFYPGPELWEAFRRNGRAVRGLRSQWATTALGALQEFPAQRLGRDNASACQAAEAVHRRGPALALATASPKRVVLLLELGNLVSDAQLERVRAVGRILLASVAHPDDSVAVVAVGSEASSPCPALRAPTPETLASLRHFIDSQPRTSAATNHSRGLEEAFRILATESERPAGPAFILYVSRGLLSSLKEKGRVMGAVAEAQLASRRPVTLHTFPVLHQRPLWETQFLGDLAAMNFHKHKASFSPALQVRLRSRAASLPKGRMVVVNGSSVPASLPLPTLLALYTPSSQRRLQPFGPSGPPSSRTVGAGLAVWQRDVKTDEEALVGVVGAEMDLGVLTAELRRAVLPLASHSLLLVHQRGWVVATDRDAEPRQNLGLDELHSWRLSPDEAQRRLGRLANVREGRMSVPVRAAANASARIEYGWRRLADDADLVLVYARPDDAPPTSATPDFQANKDGMVGAGVVYHRLDVGLSGRETRFHCMLGEQVGSTGAAGLYLSPRAFRRPRPLGGETPAAATSVWVFLTHPTNLIANPSLRPVVKGHAGALARLAPAWLADFDAAQAPHVLRRFAAAASGPLLTHPALLFPQDFEPQRRLWYTRALAKSRDLVLTGPYLDPSGSGHVVTLSKAILAKGPDGEESVFGVAGLDVTPGFLLSLLEKRVGLCGLKGMRCLLVEEGGYVLAVGNPAGSRALEWAHLTHQEPRLAVDLLQSPHSVLRKSTCESVHSGWLEREFRLSRATGLRSGQESCGGWELAAVPGTSAQLLFRNSSGCDGSRAAGAFCPCSVTDRRCLNCRRGAEAQDCECPCQCPLRFSPREESCPVHRPHAAQAPPCASPQAPLRVPRLSPSTAALLFNQEAGSRPQCLASGCEGRASELACLSVAGCGWCERSGGGSRLAEPYCGPITACFLGVEGRSPSGDASFLEEGVSVSTPVGPVAGAIIGMFVVLVVGVYCYRYQVTRLVEQRGSGGGSGARLHLAQEEEEEFRFDEDGSSAKALGGACLGQGEAVGEPLRPDQLASFERRLPGPARRRGPRTAESSDHGYSTMTATAAEDSEHAEASDALVPLATSLRARPRPASSQGLLKASPNTSFLGADGTLTGPSPETTLNASSIEDDSTTVVIAADVHRPPMESH